MATSIATGKSEPALAAEQVRREMRTIRRELGEDVEELVGHAERLMDWRYYVQRYPWASLGVVALAGFLVVPGRTITLPTDDQTLDRLADRLPQVLKSKPEAKKRTLLNSLLSMAAGFALRAATAYVTQQVGKVIASQTAPQPVEMQHD